MSKKDYIRMADIIKENRDQFSKDAIDWIAAFFLNDNIRFNRTRWIDYIDGKCGPNGGKVRPA